MNSVRLKPSGRWSPAGRAQEWETFSESRDPAGEELVKRIAEKLRSSGQQFEDPTFRANDPTSDGGGLEILFESHKRPESKGGKASERPDQDDFLVGEKLQQISFKRPNEIGDTSLKSVAFSRDINPVRIFDPVRYHP
eukprot:SAG11_NODE_1059_length_6002_cov_2.976453_2_plen_138_part_00